MLPPNTFAENCCRTVISLDKKRFPTLNWLTFIQIIRESSYDLSVFLTASEIIQIGLHNFKASPSWHGILRRFLLFLDIFYRLYGTKLFNYKFFLPMHYVVDTGNICNLSCPFCHTGVKRKGIRRGMMSKENFKIVFDKIKPYAKHIDLYNWGEPFLNKDITYMISLCADNDIHSHIDTNLSAFDLTGGDAENIVDSGLSSMFVSIDGATQSGYEKYRRGGSLARVLRNLKAIASAKVRRNAVTPVLGWIYYVHKYNEHEMHQAEELATDLGVNIWFKLLSCSANWQSSFHLQENRLGDIPDWVRDCYPLPHHPQFDRLDFHDAIKEVMGACRQPFHTMVINWNGDVMPCTTVFDESFILGNLLLGDVKTIWNNDALCNCRKFLLNFGPKQNTGAVCERLACPLSRKCHEK